MRRLAAPAAIAFALCVPAAAAAQNAQFGGFGGVTFGDVTNSTTFGAGIAVPLSDNLQIIGEGGRMTNLTPSLLDPLFDLSPVDVHVSAWYGEGGLRFIGPSHRAVRPYAEATAGFARLSAGVDGIGSTADAIVDAALGFVGKTEPLLGVGGGVIVQGGPLFVDVGYRYKKILAGESIQAALTGGDLSVNQVRVGVGVRF